MLSEKQKSDLLHDAARLTGLDSHIFNGKPQTAAEFLMVRTGGLKDEPRKNSYLFCDTIDACFYYRGTRACCTFTAKWCEGAKDLEPTRISRAMQIVSDMLKNMQELINKAVEE